jgi:hypothetical protein
VAFRAAEDRGETADPPWIHQRRIGRCDFLGENDRPVVERRIGDVRLLHEVADQPGSDDANILDPRREIGVAHLGEALGDRLDLEFDGALGVDLGIGDALVDAAHETRIRQHREMRVEQIANLVGGGTGQRGGARLQLAKLPLRIGDSVGEARSLGTDCSVGN